MSRDMRSLVEGKRPPKELKPALVAGLLWASQDGTPLEHVLKFHGITVDEALLSFAHGWLCNHVEPDCDCNGRVRVRV